MARSLLSWRWRWHLLIAPLAVAIGAGGGTSGVVDHCSTPLRVGPRARPHLAFLPRRPVALSHAPPVGFPSAGPVAFPRRRSVSVFLVNCRAPDTESPDRAFVFQPQFEVEGPEPFVPRPDPRGARAKDWDEQVADLHYADTPAYATGHGISAEWEITDGACRVLRTTWYPSRRLWHMHMPTLLACK